MSARIAAIAICFCLATRATAAIYNWNNGAGGTFSTAANWAPVGVPGSTDTVQLSVGGSFTISFSTSPNVNTFTQTQGDVTLDLNTNTFRPTSTANNILGSNGVTTILHVTDGVFRPGNLILSNVVNATSNLILDTDSSTILGTGLLNVGSSGTGNLTLQNGATLSAPGGAVLGLNSTGIGTATVTGFNSAWTVSNSNALRVGSLGAGTLNITNGGSVTVPALEVGELLNSVGTMSLSGANATFTTPGTANIGGSSATALAAAATLNIGTGATVNLNGTTNLRPRAVVNLTGGTLNLNTINATTGAAFNWSAGTVNVATGPTITTNLLDFFLAGTQTLGANRTLSATAGTITLNSTLNVTGGRIAAPIIALNANLDLTGFGAIAASNTISIAVGKRIQVGNFSTLSATTGTTNNGGTLVLNGPFANVAGAMTNTAGYITGTGRFTGGLNNGATGIVRVESGDHLIVDQPAPSNAGAIELADGAIEYSGALSNTATGFISGRGVFRGSSATPGGTGLNNVGTLAFSAGITDIFGDVSNTATGKIIAAGASVVTFYDDVVHNGVEIRTNAGSRSVFFGSVTGAGPFTGTGDVEFNGDLRPGNSPANVVFGGSVTVGPTAGLNIELAGPTKGTGYDSLTIAGSVALGGALNVTLLGGFLPAVGQSFEILTAAGGINGTFDATNLPALTAGLYFDLNYMPNAISLFVVGIPGDFNRSGTVDSADYVVWRKGLGTIYTPDEYSVWRAHFGETAGDGANVAAAPVPEPRSIALFIITSCLAATRSGARPPRSPIP
jgi:T5SS/PEP-CTERM-associated repeat protein